jgi:hypothetical protein
MTAADISKKFGLSLPAAAKRLEQFEGMYRRKHRIPRPPVPNVIDFLAEQARKGYIVKNLNQLGPILPTATPEYEGDPCPVCDQFALLRNGLSVKCDCCGARIGDD